MKSHHTTPSHSPTPLPSPPPNQGLAGHTDKKERWYGTDYSERPLSPEELALWAGCVARGAVPAAAEGAAEGAFPSTPLALPRPNDFIPTDFGLKVPLPADAAAAAAAVDAGSIALGGVGGAASSSSSSSSSSNALLEAAPSVLADDGVSMAEILAAAGEGKEAGAEGGDGGAEGAGKTEAAPEGAGEGDEEEEGDEEGDEEGEEGEEGGKVAMPHVPSRSVLLFHKPDLVWRVPKVGPPRPNAASLLSPPLFFRPLSTPLALVTLFLSFFVFFSFSHTHTLSNLFFCRSLFYWQYPPAPRSPVGQLHSPARVARRLHLPPGRGSLRALRRLPHRVSVRVLLLRRLRRPVVPNLPHQGRPAGLLLGILAQGEER